MTQIPLPPPAQRHGPQTAIGHAPSTSPSQVGRNLAKLCVQRIDALGEKGRRADDSAVHFFVGALAMADATGQHDLAKHLSMLAAMFVAPRGMAGVRELAAKA